ncbi:TFIIB-type zinc ribbon-containing protein [Allokutzneria sp. A3M-2-11 16]|uniref:TFIIB-type zinc ribbon-containing protein n=1 Tax=Allokutzneria sp. A3M-2-11 16 TaxID=2962043 RepID=UPI0027E298D7|nr:zf-TFIIB domain-containing protein [Allokutzneria sp. A3M-2-11 16]
MICPKCQNVMQTVDRQGVHIEQCTGCRGIFLDRGELEQIAQAEQRYYSAAPPPYAGGHPGHHDSPKPYRGHHDSPKPYRGGHHDSPAPYRGGGYGHHDSPRPYGHKKKKSFFDQLFD